MFVIHWQCVSLPVVVVLSNTWPKQVLLLISCIGCCFTVVSCILYSRISAIKRCSFVPFQRILHVLQSSASEAALHLQSYLVHLKLVPPSQLPVIRILVHCVKQVRLAIKSCVHHDLVMPSWLTQCPPSRHLDHY